MSNRIKKLDPETAFKHFKAMNPEVSCVERQGDQSCVVRIGEAGYQWIEFVEIDWPNEMTQWPVSSNDKPKLWYEDFIELGPDDVLQWEDQVNETDGGCWTGLHALQPNHRPIGMKIRDFRKDGDQFLRCDARFRRPRAVVIRDAAVDLLLEYYSKYPNGLICSRMDKLLRAFGLRWTGSAVEKLGILANKELPKGPKV